MSGWIAAALYASGGCVLAMKSHDPFIAILFGAGAAVAIINAVFARRAA